MRELICLCVERDDTNSYRFFALRFRGNFLARLANFRKGQFAQQRARVTLESRLRSNGMEILLLLLKFEFNDNNNNSVYNHTAICNSSPLRMPLNFSRSSDKSPYGAPYVNED